MQQKKHIKVEKNMIKPNIIDFSLSLSLSLGGEEVEEEEVEEEEKEEESGDVMGGILILGGIQSQEVLQQQYNHQSEHDGSISTKSLPSSSSSSCHGLDLLLIHQLSSFDGDNNNQQQQQQQTSSKSKKGFLFYFYFYFLIKI